MSQRTRVVPGMEIGPFTVLALARRERQKNGTSLIWRVRCGHCGREDYEARPGDLRRNQSCGCVPQRHWTGPRSDEFRASVSAARKGGGAGAANGNWKGEAAGYVAFHSYARRHFDPVPCEHCGEVKARMEWAIKHGRPLSRLREDWLMLCVRCHRFYDKNPLATGEYQRARSRR